MKKNNFDKQGDKTGPWEELVYYIQKVGLKPTYCSGLYLNGMRTGLWKYSSFDYNQGNFFIKLLHLFNKRFRKEHYYKQKYHGPFNRLDKTIIYIC